MKEGKENIKTEEGTDMMEETKIADIVSRTIQKIVSDAGQFPMCQLEKSTMEAVRKVTEQNAKIIEEHDKDINGNSKDGLKQDSLRTALELQAFKDKTNDFMDRMNKIGMILIGLLITLVGTSFYTIITSPPPLP